ncbi:SDR family NAD(P)-dependent oxidoreductase [Demequina mangrovi]|uniref:Short-chain dehydrogenase n=1 Tax=Demequina mangrovi TaxID=1043493 RepID=A0A1H6YEW1_9MICO|nr:SDR family NAD(P)-dependent oxidoreductase [Demequina mangrovi]SEJ39818.1 hypothetical protein SAMN05421637_1709 [Demequina mangrovi]
MAGVLVPRRAVVIGATSGMAEAVMRLWVSGGTGRLHLVGRSRERLEAVAGDLAARSDAVEVTIHACDLTDPAAISAAVGEVSALDPDVVLIAHGAMYEQADMQEDLALADQQLRVTGVSPVLWAEACVDALDRGVVAVIGSVAGDRGRRKNYLYGSSKGMVERAVEGMQHRVHGSRQRVVLIKPGPTATPMTAALDPGGLADVDEVARSIAVGIAKGAPVLYVPGQWRAIMAVIRSMPRPVFNRLDL